MNRPIQQRASQAVMSFDGNRALCFYILMGSDVDIVTLTSVIPGCLYTFKFLQDAAGNHRFTWPSSCVNAAPIDLNPDSVTVEHFIGSPGNVLLAHIPPTYA